MVTSHKAIVLNPKTSPQSPGKHHHVIYLSDSDSDVESAHPRQGVRFATDTPMYREVTPSATSSRHPGSIQNAGYQYTPLCVINVTPKPESEKENQSEQKQKVRRDTPRPRKTLNHPPRAPANLKSLKLPIIDIVDEDGERRHRSQKDGSENVTQSDNCVHEALVIPGFVATKTDGNQLPKETESELPEPRGDALPMAQPPNTSLPLTPTIIHTPLLNRDAPPHLPPKSSVKIQDAASEEEEEGNRSEERMRKWKEKEKWKQGASPIRPAHFDEVPSWRRRLGVANSRGDVSHWAFQPTQELQQVIQQANKSVSIPPQPFTLQL
ncbi:hypothetical protein E1B28_005117 [Marasmius oreades]|uniref:Uncharacterized protein n=1 Tax=Marasmius oreades TaxID=181124 RepID=A0A9P8ADT3_9AGAR|nr:uncharacterized protein E1B28_005117 [Marasmius oreades]KAG7097798.1 hypothetical protein E1B28_005117 [Marasmius oreades]